MSRSRRWLAVLVVGALAFGLAACGDDDDDTTAEGGGSADTTETTAALSGEPIKVAHVSSSLLLPKNKIALEAAAKAVNAEGGVHGRPIEVVACDGSNTDPNKAAQCVRDAVGDSAVLANVGNFTAFGAQTNPIQEQAGLACIGCSLSTQPDFASPVVFPNQGGAVGSIIGMARINTDVLDVKTIGLPYLDVPTGAQLPALLKATVTGPRKLPEPVSVPIAVTAADVSSQVATIGNTDGVVLALTADLGSRVIKTARQQGYDKPIVISAGSYSEEILQDQLGNDVEEIYAGAAYDHTSKGYEQFLDELKKYGGKDGLSAASDTALQGWLAVHTFADVANGITGELTRQSILDAMKNLKGYDTKGLSFKPLDYTEKATFLGGALPNLRPSVQGIWMLDYTAGKLVPSKKSSTAIDIGAAPKS